MIDEPVVTCIPEAPSKTIVGMMNVSAALVGGKEHLAASAWIEGNLSFRLCTM